MRILLINQHYWPDVAATGQYLTDLAQGLARRGHEVHVLCSRRPYSGLARLYPAREVRMGVVVHRVGARGGGRGRLLARAADYLSFHVLALGRAVRMRRMDLCVCLTTPPLIGVVGLLLRRLRGTRLALWVMDVYPEVAVAFGVIREGSVLHRLLAAAGRAVYRAAGRVIALGETMAERLLAAGADPRTVVTVHNWVPGENVAAMPHGASPLYREGGRERDVVVMYSGNVGIGHDLETIVRAVAGLRGEPIRLLIVGRGRNRRPLQALVGELGLARVEFHDPRPLAQLSDSLAAADVHLVSQRDRTQGLIVPSKIYGILAAARAVLFCGPEDCEVAQIVRAAGCGLVVPPGDLDRARRALARLAREKDLRQTMGRRARTYYDTHFGRDRSVGRIIDAILDEG